MQSSSEYHINHRRTVTNQSSNHKQQPSNHIQIYQLQQQQQLHQLPHQLKQRKTTTMKLQHHQQQQQHVEDIFHLKINNHSIFVLFNFELFKNRNTFL